MDSGCVLEWEMHGVDTFVSFRARRTEHGYGLFVTRDDDTLLISDTAVDGAALFRKSQDLRAAFQGMGYTPKRSACRASHLTGGVCWGPAAPVAAEVLQAINEPTDHIRPAA
jgi:hypothetical protein